MSKKLDINYKLGNISRAHFPNALLPGNMEYRNQCLTNVHRHLPIAFYCRDFIIKCGQKVALIENNG